MKKKGFTLVELMIVIVIIGILAAIAIPKFADMVDKSKEGATKGQLTSLRSALNIYYSDNEGKYINVKEQTTTVSSTTVLQNYLVPKYIASIPVAKLPRKNNNHNCTPESSIVYAVDFPTANVKDSGDNTGGWAYDGKETNSSWGDIRVNCSGKTLDLNHYWTEF
jgi:type II secretion system protein G